MSYCPEHGGPMSCRNPDAYDGLVYDCQEGHTIVYQDGAYLDSKHPDAYIPEDALPDCHCQHAASEHLYDDGYSPCQVEHCACNDYHLPDDSPVPTQPTHTHGMTDVMVVRNNQLIAKDYDT